MDADNNENCDGGIVMKKKPWVVQREWYVVVDHYRDSDSESGEDGRFFFFFLKIEHQMVFYFVVGSF